ncbi:hypothetical protein EDD22DRAFT_1008251 [Suillus occidentalis]|nr:hypothetical protein EDD22DRAFT_1008251 [Suillus occidentalis]
MLFPPKLTAILPKPPLETWRNSGSSGSTGLQDMILKNMLDCNTSVFDQDAWGKLVKGQQTKDLIQSILDTIGCSPCEPPSEQVQQGINILLKWVLGTGKKTVALAICNKLRCLMLDIWVNDIPHTTKVGPWATKVASRVIQWNAVVVADHGDYFMKSQSPVQHLIHCQERIDTMIQAFESPGCISATVLSSKDASAIIVWDVEEWTFIREIEKISWYELDGTDIKDFMNLVRSSAEGHNPTPQHMKASLKDWGVPLSVWSKVARFFALHEIHPPVLPLDEPRT